MKNKRQIWDGDVLKIKTSKRMVKRLEKIQELQVLDLKGNLKMTFWKGEPHE